MTSDSIQLAWDSPKYGADSVQSYTISYCMKNDPTEQWKFKRTQGSVNTTTITQLAPKTKYCFRIHAHCEIGVSPESEISDPIETSPDYTVAQIWDKPCVSSEPIGYPLQWSRNWGGQGGHWPPQ